MHKGELIKYRYEVNKQIKEAEKYAEKMCFGLTGDEQINIFNLEFTKK
tara:strand:- start:883 stop:1026 length:144 start_codon:yes stop_codon:yes gene_type:complete